MSNLNDHPENLGVRARRNALLPSEQAELERVLAASSTLRMAYQLGKDFDQIAAVEAGDEQRIEHFVDRALAERWRRRHRLFGLGRLSPWMAAAAVLAVCGVAFGVRGVWWPLRTSAPSVATAIPSAAPARPKPRPARPPRAATEPLDEPSAATNPSNQNDMGPSLPSSSASPTAPLNSVTVRAIRQAPPLASAPTSARVTTDAPERKGSVATFAPEQPSESNAGTLLRQANRARSLGELDRAVSLLNELQSKFPGSAQAHVSLVSLGKLLMQRGMPDAALQRFSSYLATSGPLEEEALVGRAQALAMLGRAIEERNTWERLLARFPGSVYAGSARKRIEVLAKASAE